MDLATFGGAIGIFFGRIANFINGELVGRAAPPDALWSVKFPQDILSWPHYAPEHLLGLSAITPLVGVPSQQWDTLITQINLNPQARDLVEGVLHRIVQAVQSGNSVILEQLSPLLVARYPSQLYQALLEGGTVAIVLLAFALKKRAHGVFASLFLILYSIMRIIGEQYRMPDLQIGFQWLGLTRGQWLSFGTIALGAVCLFAVTRKKERNEGSLPISAPPV
jgi:phosphatidylglycerol:prolipoprotein diacylglycerol transferase